MTKKLILQILALFFSSFILAQSDFTLSGKITDAYKFDSVLSR